MYNRLDQVLVDKYSEHAREANILREMLLERSQLYGTLLTILKREKIANLEISEDELIEAGKTLLVFTPSDDKKILTISFKEVEDNVSVEE